MNINTAYIAHTYFTTLLSFFANVLLIFLILKKTPSGMKTYSNVLLQTCVIDLFITFLTCFTIIQGETSHGRIFIRSAAPWFPVYGYYPCFGIWLYLIALSTVYWSMFVQPLFRYFHIVRRTTLTPIKTWILHFLIIFSGTLLGFHYSFTYCSNEDLRFNKILTFISPWRDEQTLDGFRSQDLMNFNVVIYISAIAFVATICNSIFIFCTYKVVKSLKNASTKYSKQTLKMHKQLNQKCLYQTIFPIISLIMLLCTCVMAYSKFIENTGIILFALMFFQYITVFNPIITILTIQNYRNFFTKKKSAVKSISTTVSKSNRYQERPQTFLPTVGN